jgi:rubrerythrin
MPPTTQLTTRETAELLRISTATVNRLIQAGELKAHKKTATDTNSPYLVDADSVAEYDRRRQGNPLQGQPGILRCPNCGMFITAVTLHAIDADATCPRCHRAKAGDFIAA